MERGEAKRQLLGSAMVAQSSSRAGPRRAARSAKGGGARARAPSLALRRAHWAAASAVQPIESVVTLTARGDWLGCAHSRPAVLQRDRSGELDGLRAGEGRRRERWVHGAPCWLPRRAAHSPPARVEWRHCRRSGLPAARLNPSPFTGPVLQ